MARTTQKTVLADSIKDIQDGLWICGDLMQAAEANGTQKPKGCAVGLAVINARLAQVVIVKDEDSETGMFATCKFIDNPSYYFQSQNQAMFPKQRRDALRLSLVSLALAIPMEDRETVWDDEAKNSYGTLGDDVPIPDKDIKKMTIDELENMIIEYNDSGIDSESAEGWFKAAYAIATKSNKK